MEVGSPEWIEASLARLDQLEKERGEREAALESETDPALLKQHNDALDRLDDEIKTLYAQLEAIAGEEEEEDEAEDANVVPHVTEGDDELSAPHIVSPTPSFDAAPAAPPAVAPATPPAAPPVETPFGSSPDSGYEAALGLDDDLPKGGGAKWAFVGVLVLAGAGVGGYFAWQNYQAQQQSKQAKPEQVEEIRIESAKVREDTEAPKAAKGADATISPTAHGHTSGSGSSSGSSKSSGGSSNKSSGSSSKKDDKNKKPLQLNTGADPLG